MSREKNRVHGFELFTDAASRGNNNPNIPSEGGSAAILFFNKTPRKYFGKYLPNATNNYGESSAILIGILGTIEMLSKLENVKFPIEVTVYSDSVFSIKSIRDWSQKWIKDYGIDGQWINSSGEPVANQDVFRTIIKTVKGSKDIKFKFMHVRGHLDETKSKDILTWIKSYKTNNRVLETMEFCRYCIENNRLVDELANKIVDSKQDYNRVLIESCRGNSQS